MDTISDLHYDQLIKKNLCCLVFYQQSQTLDIEGCNGEIKVIYLQSAKQGEKKAIA